MEQGISVAVRSEYHMNKKLLKDPPRYAWILGGWGPCSESCGGGKRQKTAACFDTHGNKIVQRKHCSLVIKPRLESEKCNTFSCSFYWVPGPWEPCSKTCGSYGVQLRETYCVPQSALSGTPISLNISNINDPWNYMVSPIKCGGIQPATARPCHRVPCPVEWVYGEWSQCSTSCGLGISTRRPHCPALNNEKFYSCGPEVPPQRKTCKGGFTRLTNPSCKRKKKKICVADQSAHCFISLLAKYCRLIGFRKLCCKTCSNNRLTRIIQ